MINLDNTDAWAHCIEKLKSVLSDQEISTWIRPLQCFHDNATLQLFAPNRYVLYHVKQNFFQQIEESALSLNLGINAVRFEIGSHDYHQKEVFSDTKARTKPKIVDGFDSDQPFSGNKLNAHYTFENHIEGNSNQLARAASIQVGSSLENSDYNPLFIYGGVGLGKTHLMQAAGNAILSKNPKARVVYVHSEFFVNDMIKALRNNTINKFKQYYRSLDVLLIDDIQFFAKKTLSQEEFFHTFNTLLEGEKKIIITSDRIPKAIADVEERLISRLDSGLSVGIEPPELETRVAIIEKKALHKGVDLPRDVAFFIANTVRSNVRELEGALNRIIANARFLKRDVDVSLASEALQDLLSFQQQRISIENIQKTVAGYFKIRVADLLSKKRTRDIARPRQLAMMLAKQHTTLSLPKIGDRFGGRDHTTVLHACRKIEELKIKDVTVKEDYDNLQRLLGN